MVKKTDDSCSSSKKTTFNRGVWTAEEDEKLANYMKIHGDKKWRSLPVKAGLNRCGKSCRLRWLNYLRPGIKRGNISEDEEDLIIRLHNLLGNRWSLIAGRLPGRTDNEIKNHWNTHLSKKSLTINELNLKLNQKHEVSSDCSSTSSDFPVVANDAQNSLTVSKPWSEAIDSDFDFHEFFNLQESDLKCSIEFGDHDYDFKENGIYENLMNKELQKSNNECLDQQIMFDQLDFDSLTRFLEYEDDAFLNHF